MCFARWALSKPKPPTVDEVMEGFAVNRATARIWRNHWLATGPHATTSTPLTENLQ